MAVDVGEVVPLGIVVRDVDAGRTPINAVTVALRLTLPDLTVLNPIVINPPGVTGNYIYDYIPTLPGLHIYRWQTTTPTLVLEGSFDVLAPGLPGLISLSTAKELLRIPPTDDKFDDSIRSVIRAATRAAEREISQVIARRTMVETKRIRTRSPRLVLTHRPVQAVVSIVNIDTGFTWAPPDIDVDENGIVETGAGIAQFYGRLRCTSVAGYTIVPDDFQEAIGYIVQHLWMNRQGSGGRPRAGGQSGDGVSEMGYSIPNRARDLLGHAGPLVG